MSINIDPAEFEALANAAELALHALISAENRARGTACGLRVKILELTALTNGLDVDATAAQHSAEILSGALTRAIAAYQSERGDRDVSA